MAEDSILKPLDLPDETAELSSGLDEEVTTTDDSSESTVTSTVETERTSFLTVGAQKPWDIEETKFGKIATVGVVDEMKKSYLDYAMSVIVSRARI